MNSTICRILRANAMLLFALASVVPSGLVYAECQNKDEQSRGQNEQRPPRREPPPQAYEDCKGKKAGDVVQIKPPGEGYISATCTDSSKGLFARPAHPPRDQDNDQAGDQTQKNK